MLLALFSIPIIAASIAGGLLPTLVKFTHLRIQLMMSFVSGIMLGVAVFHLLPHAIHQRPDTLSIDTIMLWLMAGLFTMFMLLRLFHFHQHDVSTEDHNHEHPLDDCGVAHSGNGSQLGWVGIAFGMAVHTIIDGIALGASLQAINGDGLELAGLGVFLAILLHKPLDAMTITTTMRSAGISKQGIWLANGLFALMCPLGALLFVSGIQIVGDVQATIVVCTLAFAAGTFLCISLSDLLPEIQFHSHDRFKFTLALMLGITLAYGIVFLEGDLHDHSHQGTTKHSSENHSVETKINHPLYQVNDDNHHNHQH